MPVIRVQGLTKRYGTATAVDNLSFEVQPGTVCGFLGPNGAGKTTTLRILAGLVRPDAGEALIDERPLRELPRPAAAAGAVLEGFGFHPQRTVAAHLRVLAALRSAGLPARPDGGAVVVDGADVDRVGRVVRDHGILLHEMSPVATLEDAYLGLVGDGA